MLDSLRITLLSLLPYQIINHSSNHSDSNRQVPNLNSLLVCKTIRRLQRCNINLIYIDFKFKIFRLLLNVFEITHVNNLIKSSHAMLRSMRRFKRFTPYKVRKTLAEALILSNLRYCIPVYSQLPKYLIRRLQRTQNTVTDYVLGR